MTLHFPKVVQVPHWLKGLHSAKKREQVICIGNVKNVFCFKIFLRSNWKRVARRRPGDGQASRTGSPGSVLHHTTYSGLWPDSCCRFHRGSRVCSRIHRPPNDPRRGRTPRTRSRPRSGRTGRPTARLLSAWCWYDLSTREEQKRNKHTMPWWHSGFRSIKTGTHQKIKSQEATSLVRLNNPVVHHNIKKQKGLYNLFTAYIAAEWRHLSEFNISQEESTACRFNCC